MDKKILSISDAASILGVSDETLRNWERACGRYFIIDGIISAKIYGRRSSQNRKKKEKEEAE